MRACFTSQVHYDQGLFGIVSGVSGIMHSISGSTGYIGEVYITGSDGEWCQVQCSTPFSCTDLSGCHVVYDTGHQAISGDLVVTGYISGSSLHIGDCALTVTTGGRIGINTCDPLCDIDIRGDICHNSGNYLNNSGYISGETGIFDWLSGNSGYMRDEFTVGVGDCVFIVTTGGDIGINTCDPLCDIDIRGDICHNSGNYLNNSGYISGETGIFDWLSGNSGYMRDEFTVGVGDCVFIVTTGGDIGINTCDPLCDIDIRGDVCHNSGNYLNNSGYISGETGIFDWLSGNSGYMRDEFTVGVGDCVFIVTTGGDIGINTCDPLCDIDIRGDVCVSGDIAVSGTISSAGGVFGGLSPILWTGVPSTDTSYGLAGLAAYSNTHLYICTGANKWGRTNLTGWN